MDPRPTPSATPRYQIPNSTTWPPRTDPPPPPDVDVVDDLAGGLTVLAIVCILAAVGAAIAWRARRA